MNSTNGCCRMCGNTVNVFPKSHIIPRSFFSGLPQKCCVESIWRDGDSRLTRNALWEKGIVCADCEKRLAHFDQYACLVFNQRKDSQLRRIDEPHGIIVFESVDRTLLRGFLATLLWRMSISSLKEFEGVSIDKAFN